MRYIIPMVSAILAALLQITMPAYWFSHLVVIDVSLITVIIISLLSKSYLASLWIALLAGLIMDIWLPSHFGVWTLAALSSSLVTIIITTKIIPRQTGLSILVSAGAALLAGTGIVFLVSWFGSNLSLVGHIIEYLLFYLVKVILDLLILWFLLFAAKRIINIFYPRTHVRSR